MLRALKTVTFVYVPQEDRIAGAINAGHPDAWSCWLTRRLALAVLERATEYIANTSNLAQRAPAELRGEASPKLRRRCRRPRPRFSNRARSPLSSPTG
jgi:predicted alpha/beta hydrolase